MGVVLLIIAVIVGLFLLLWGVSSLGDWILSWNLLVQIQAEHGFERARGITWVIIIAMILTPVIISIVFWLATAKKRNERYQEGLRIREEQRRKELIEQEELRQKKQKQAEEKRRKELKKQEEFRRECRELGFDPARAGRCPVCNITITESGGWCDACERKDLPIKKRGRLVPPDKNLSIKERYRYIYNNMFLIFPLLERNPQPDQIMLPFAGDIKWTAWIDTKDGFCMLGKEHLMSYINRAKKEAKYTSKNLFNEKIKKNLERCSEQYVGYIDFEDFGNKNTGEYTRIVPAKRRRYSASCLFNDALIKHLAEQEGGENLIFAVPTLSFLYYTNESDKNAIECLRKIAKQKFNEATDNWPITENLVCYNVAKRKFEIYKTT
jgi:hypothetical protein